MKKFYKIKFAPRTHFAKYFFLANFEPKKLEKNNWPKFLVSKLSEKNKYFAKWICCPFSDSIFESEVL